jgi:CTP synthase
MESQKKITQKGGTMRLGNYACELEDGSISKSLYNKKEIVERHRHRFEFNDEYKELFIEKGMKFTGTGPENRLVEIMEIPNHPWFVGCQFHPEFKSSPIMPHPLFMGFIKAALKQAKI